VKEKVSTRDVHSYVDNCMDAEACTVFEARLRDDADLAQSVEAWRIQSEAIRRAFNAEGLAFGPSQSALRTRLKSEARGGALVAGRFRATLAAPAAKSQSRWALKPGRSLVLSATFLIGLLAAPGATSPWPRDAMQTAGAAAFRAFWMAPPAALDYRAKDAEQALNALSPVDRHENLSTAIVPAGWRLRGVKRAPGALGEAQFAIVERGEAEIVGVLVEPLDGPPAAAGDLRSLDGFATASFARDGLGFVAAARNSAALATWLSGLAPTSGAARQTGR
jgi:hypothetical protein